jgi:superfamily II DNA or RNA helicase
MVPGAHFMPSYRNKHWDGKIRLYSIYDYTLYAGLLDYVLRFADERDYTFEYRDNSEALFAPNAVEPKSVEKYFEEFLKPHSEGKPLTAYDHQLEAVTHALRNDRCLLVCPTASGKSLIIYALIRYYLSKLPKKKKILIVVPTTSLVSQMFTDFQDYASEDSWDVDKNCHVVFAGRDKIAKQRVIISTWQSIYKMPKKYFDNFGAVFGDECHLFKANSLRSIMEKLHDCYYRIGTTGTLDGTQTHKLVLEGLFGPAKKVISTKELMDKDLLSQLSIDCILLKYPDEVCNACKKLTYKEEIDFLVSHRGRNKFIRDLTLKLNGNTLVLFQLVEKHGKGLHKSIEKIAKSGRKVFFVYGGTEVTQREEVRRITEKENDAVIVASYGTFSTGINIKRLHNIVFASPSKSRIRILQSLGRSLRKGERKDLAKLYDIADDLHWKKRLNYTLKHFISRVKLYNDEQFDYRTVKIDLP